MTVTLVIRSNEYLIAIDVEVEVSEMGCPPTARPRLSLGNYFLSPSGTITRMHTMVR